MEAEVRLQGTEPVRHERKLAHHSVNNFSRTLAVKRKKEIVLTAAGKFFLGKRDLNMLPSLFL